MAQQGPLCNAGIPCVAQSTPGLSGGHSEHPVRERGAAELGVQSPLQPQPHCSLLNPGTVTCGRAGDEPRESCQDSRAASPTHGAHQLLGHPSPTANSTEGNPRHIHDLPVKRTMCFPPFLLGSRRRGRAPWWWRFPFLGAVHELREEREALQGWGLGCAPAPVDLGQPRAKDGGHRP